MTTVEVPYKWLEVFQKTVTSKANLMLKFTPTLDPVTTMSGTLLLLLKKTIGCDWSPYSVNLVPITGSTTTYIAVTHPKRCVVLNIILHRVTWIHTTPFTFTHLDKVLNTQYSFPEIRLSKCVYWGFKTIDIPGAVECHHTELATNSPQLPPAHQPTPPPQLPHQYYTETKPTVGMLEFWGILAVGLSNVYDMCSKRWRWCPSRTKWHPFWSSR